MTPERLVELRRLCAGARWDNVSEPMIVMNEGAVLVWLPDATVAAVSGAPVKAFIEQSRAAMVELLDEVTRLRAALLMRGEQP